MSPSAAGVGFLSPKQARKAVNAGQFPLKGMPVQPHVFWRSVVSGKPYRVKGLWIMGSNPLLTQTNSLDIEKSLRDLLDFTVVSDHFLTPTAQLADLVLPSATWLETDDVVNLHKIWCVLARRKVAQVGQVRENKEVMIQLAGRLGLAKAFPWKSFAQYLDWVLEDSGMDFDAFSERGIVTGSMRYEKHKHRGFATASGKFEFFLEGAERLGAAPLPTYREPALSPLASPEVHQEYPLTLCAGRSIRNFFNSEGRQIKSLRKASPDPLLQIHPDKAAELGIAEGDWVWIETPGGRRVMQRASLFTGIRPDNVNAQYGWWFPEDPPPEHGWKKYSINLLFDQQGGYDPETGSECLHSYLCRVYRA
jgi:anaerobic selenocysteine-containing dehydrogenase